MNKVKYILNLENPKSCRDFLEHLECDQGRVTFIETLAGDKIYIKDMNDKQVCIYAKQLHEDLFK